MRFQKDQVLTKYERGKPDKYETELTGVSVCGFYREMTRAANTFGSIHSQSCASEQCQHTTLQGKVPATAVSFTF